MVDARAPANLGLHLIVDDYATHKHRMTNGMDVNNKRRG